MKYNFAMTGVGGFVASRHLKAISDTNNRLVAAVDPHDSVGVLDRFFPDVRFFTEFERFDRHLEKLRRGPDESKIHYLAVCSPNYLHDAHCRLALRIGANVICEKPLVINPWNLDALKELELESGAKINTVLQLRLHPSAQKLKKRILEERPSAKHDVHLIYITSRGAWYDVSWKGIQEKSGGIATNIGIHFFDLLLWLFGCVGERRVYLANSHKMAGYLDLELARVKWFLSVDQEDLPIASRLNGDTTFRNLTIDGECIDFTGGFADLHTRVYEEVLAGRGFGIDDARPSIQLVHNIRTSPVIPRNEFLRAFFEGGPIKDLKESS